MVSKLAARSRWSRGATPANDRSAASPLTRASVSVLASWLASWGAATGPDVGAFHEDLALAAGRVALRQPSELVEEPAALLRRSPDRRGGRLTAAVGWPVPSF